MKKSIISLLFVFLMAAPGNAFAKTAYLSFDDGPSNCTMPILEILAKEKIKATFFVTGTAEENQKYLYKEMVKQGHALGLHTYSHDYRKIYRSKEGFFQDLDQLEDLLKKEVGQVPKIFRFPGGSNNYVSKQYSGRKLMDELIEGISERGYKYYDWNCDANDGFTPPVPKERLVRLITNNIEDQEHLHILLHDFNSNTSVIEALPEIIKNVKEKGYTFKVIDENTPVYQFRCKK